MNKKQVARQPAKKKAITKARTRAAASAQVRAPKWLEWNPERPVSVLKAALLSMGISPVPGIVSALKDRPRRMREFRRREQLFVAAHKAGDLSSDKALPRTVPLHRALEFAIESAWTVPKNVLNALERMQREMHARAAQRSDETPAKVAQPVEPRAAPNARNTFTVSASNDQSSSSEGGWGTQLVAAKQPPRNQDLLHAMIGALATIVADVARQGNQQYLLKGEGDLNRSALVARIAKHLREQVPELPHTSDRNLQHLLLEGLRAAGRLGTTDGNQPAADAETT